MTRAAVCVLFLGLAPVLGFTQTGNDRASTVKPARTPPVLRGNDTKQSGDRTPVLTDNSKGLAPSASATPKKQTDDEVIKVDTNLVTTPVSVLDRSGRFIPGLKKRDFKILEDGVPQKITYFQSEEQPFTVILMLDVSPSTRYKMDDIHYAAVTFINQLRPTDKVMVVAFDQRARLLTPEPTSDKQELFAAIYKSQFGSGTSLYDAVDAVLNLDQVTAPGRKAIVLFTDGVDTTSRRSGYQDTVAEVEEADALVYTIRFDTLESYNGGRPRTSMDLSQIMGGMPGPQYPPGMVVRMGRGQSTEEYEKGRQYLQALADNSGGRLFEADTITNMEASFSGVAEELRRQYSVGYYPDDTGKPGDRRHIKIQIVAKPNVVVRAKTSYVIKQKGEETN